MYVDEEDIELIRELSEVYSKLFSELEKEEIEEESRRRKDGYLEVDDIENARKIAAELEQYNNKVIEFALIMFTNDLLSILRPKLGGSDIILSFAREAIRAIIENRKRQVENRL